MTTTTATAIRPARIKAYLRSFFISVLSCRSSSGGSHCGTAHDRVVRRRRPTAAQGLEQAHRRLEARDPYHRENVLRLEQGLLCVEQRDEVDRALAQPRLGEIER